MSSPAKVAATLLAALVIGACANHAPERAELQPQPQLGPLDVVRAQLDALGRNSRLSDNGGIRIAWRFASEANRVRTGPVEQFIRVLYTPEYQNMLDHRRVRYGPAMIDGGSAAVPVTLTTIDLREIRYVFYLSRQSFEGCTECWMTDAVEAVGGELRPRTPRIGV